MPFDRLYKKDSSGRIRIWDIRVEPYEGDAFIIKTRTGLEDGTINEPTGSIVSEGKQNRTIREQADSEAQSKWMSKLDEGYKITRATAITDIVVLPMLAQTFSKASRHIEYPAAGQRKFDGVRCISMSAEGYPSGIVLLTRKNKEFAGLDLLRAEIALLNLPPSIILDGELYSDTLTFQRVSGLVRKKYENMSERDIADLDQVSYRVYDLINLSNREMTFVSRYRLLQSLLNAVSSQTPRIIITRNVRISNEEDVTAYLALFEEEGFEGLMIRNLESPYELNKRSKHLQKVKTFIDAEFPIVGYYEATGNDRGTPIWECEAPNGRLFRARPMGTLAERYELWANRDAMIGRPLTVRFFEYTDDGVPRFPVGVAIRDYEGEEFEADSGWMGMRLAGGLDEMDEMLGKKKSIPEVKEAEAPLVDLSNSSPYEIKIYVPSTQGEDSISESELSDRIKFIQSALSTLYGGYTTISAEGGYIGDSSELTSEPVGVVSTWANTEDYEDKLPDLEELLMYCRELWDQETIGFEFENDFFMYPESNLFEAEEEKVTIFYQVKYQETASSEDGALFIATTDLENALAEAEKLLSVNIYRVEVYRVTRFMMRDNVLLNTDLIFSAKYDYWTTNTPNDADLVESISRRFPNRDQM